MKNIGPIVLMGVASLTFLYGLLVLLVIFICWVTGLPPAHLLPGMSPYDQWTVK